MMDIKYKSIVQAIEWAKDRGHSYAEFAYLNPEIVDQLIEEKFHVTISGPNRVYYVRWAFS